MNFIFLWCSEFCPCFAIQIKREWISKGISTIVDFLGTMNVPLTMFKFTEKYQVKTNFLEYHSLISKIKNYIEWRDLPLHDEEQPLNIALNTILNLSVKGSSKLYTLLNGSSDHILDIASERWNEKTDLNILRFSLRQSFNYHHHRYKYTYLKYIQFRTLHHRFYTNDLLFNTGIKKSNLCSFCIEHIDSISHMLLSCVNSIDLWGRVELWIRELGMANYNLSSDKIILGDLENATCINTIIVLTKKSIYNVMKKEQIPSIFSIKNDIKNFYFLEKYRHYVKGKGIQFEKQYSLLSNIYTNRP